jgi:WD40-like Beta Propeller Repeat
VPRTGKETLVVDGTAGAEYDQVVGPVFSADGKHVACVCTRSGKKLVVLDGKEQKAYPYIAFINSRRPGAEGATDPKALYFSPNGVRLVYFAGTLDRWRLVEGASESEEWQSVGSPAFSPDSQNLAFRAGRNERPFLVVNGAARAMEGKTTEVGLRYSPDGKRLAHILVAVTGRMCVVVDGLAGAQWDHIASEVDGNNLWFSPDSEHLAYIAERALKWCLVRDGVEGKPYYAIAAVRFSPNSKHLACLADVALGRRVVIDGAEVPMKVTDRIIAGLRWENGDTYYTAVQRGSSVVRLEVSVR